MQKTGIEWCDSTWNPITGCLNGCSYCYAKKIAERFGSNPCESSNCLICIGCTKQEEIGFKCKDYDPITTVHTVEDKVYRFNPKRVVPFPFGFEPTFHKYRLNEPNQHKKAQRIFVCSMADLFGPWVPDEWIVSVFDACKKAPWHKYMFLTKFPERYEELALKGLLPSMDNFWYGQSASSGMVQAFLGPYHQFLSAEPLFEIVEPCGFELVIIGAETGNRKGKITPDESMISITSLRSMCHVFMKDSLVPIIGEDHMLRQMPDCLMCEFEETTDTMIRMTPAQEHAYKKETL